jgi:hypothetical protein
MSAKDTDTCQKCTGFLTKTQFFPGSGPSGGSYVVESAFPTQSQRESSATKKPSRGKLQYGMKFMHTQHTRPTLARAQLLRLTTNRATPDCQTSSRHATHTWAPPRSSPSKYMHRLREAYRGSVDSL